ncbi:MAG: RluA family pseudouridine synthase [Burkholderiales bacterium]
MRLDQALARMFPEFSRSQLQQWLRDDRIRVDGGGRVPPSRRVAGGEHVSVTPPPLPDETAHEPEDIPLRVVFEDEHLIVIDKPAGLVVHPAAGNWSGTLLNALLAHAPSVAGLPRAGIVHRLDKDTSGLMVIAKSLHVQTALTRQIQARDVRRIYLAIASGRLPATQTVEAPVGRHPTQRTRMTVIESGKPARTHVRPIAGGQGWTLVECALDTGRTHQIRVHLAHVGLPLLGDPVYGPARLSPGLAEAVGKFSRQALHAHRLAFDHPATGERLEWSAAPPPDFEGLLDRLRERAC